MASRWADEDVNAMLAALDEARKAADEGEIPVGAVVVVSDEIIARGRNCSQRSHDPSAHAEVVALRAAGAAQANHRLTGATLFVTLEPCAMCVGAIVQARINRVVFGAYDSKAGALGGALDLADSRAFNHDFEVNGGLLRAESEALLRAFFGARR